MKVAKFNIIDNEQNKNQSRKSKNKYHLKKYSQIKKKRTITTTTV